MTPLNKLLIEALAIAKQREPGLSDSIIAYRAGITQPTLSRAKRRCGPSTLEAVLDAVGLELALVAPPAQPTRARKPRAASPARSARAGSPARANPNTKSSRRPSQTAFVAHSTSHPYARSTARRAARSAARSNDR